MCSSPSWTLEISIGPLFTTSSVGSYKIVGAFANGGLRTYIIDNSDFIIYMLQVSDLQSEAQPYKQFEQEVQLLQMNYSRPSYAINDPGIALRLHTFLDD